MATVTAIISPIITPANKPTPVRASSANGVRQWKDANGKALPGADVLAKDMESYASSINNIITTLKQSPQLTGLSSIINSEVQIINGPNSITLDPTTNRFIATNGVNTLIIDPSGPSLTMVTGTGGNKLTFTLAGSVVTISGTGTHAGGGNITIDGVLTAANAALGMLTVTSSLIAASAVITGTLSAGNVSTGNVSASSYTASGSPGVSVTATVRNSAGSGTSALVFTDGILTSYTP